MHCTRGKEIAQLREEESLVSDKINNMKNEMKFDPKMKATMKGIESVNKVCILIVTNYSHLDEAVAIP